MAILDDILGERDLNKVGANRVDDELDAVLFKDEPQVPAETPIESVAPSEDTPMEETPEPNPAPIESEIIPDEVPAEEPKDDAESELNQIFDDLFGNKEESDAST